MAHSLSTVLPFLCLSIFPPSIYAQALVSTTYTSSPSPETSNTPTPTPSLSPFTDPDPEFATSTTTDTNTPWAICATGGNDWMIDPPTATRLADLFCDDVYKLENFPIQGSFFNTSKYPTDLLELTYNETNTSNSPLLPSNNSLTTPYSYPNYTAIEHSGVITSFLFGRNWPTTIDNVTHISGTPEECSLDNQTSACYNGFHHVIDKCQWNSHEYGGAGFWQTGCGLYQMFVANCSGNWDDPDCARWHSKWPNVGMTKGQPITTATWTITFTWPTLTTLTGTVTDSVM